MVPSKLCGRVTACRAVDSGDQVYAAVTVAVQRTIAEDHYPCFHASIR